MDQIQQENQWDDEAVFDSDADMVPAEKPEEENTENYGEEPVRAAGWRVLAVLFLLLGVGGLFLGMLSRLVTAFSHVASFTLYSASIEALSGSLAGYAIGYLTELFGNFTSLLSGGISGILGAVVNLLLIAALAVAVLTSVITFIVALASKKRARSAAIASGVLVFLAYAGLFLWNLFTESQSAAALTSEVCDLPTATVAAAALIALCIGVIASDKWNLFNVVMLLVPLLAAFLMCYPGTLTILIAPDIFSFGDQMFVKAAMLSFMVVIALNLFISAIRIAAWRRYAFDCVRFAFMLVSAALVVVSFVLVPDGGMAIFQGTQLYCTIGWLALTVLGFVFAIIVTVLSKKRDAAYAEEENYEEYGEAYDEDYAESAEEPVEGSAVEPAEEAAEEPEEEPGEEPAEEAAEEPEEEPGETEAPISEFERRMEALARGEQPEPAAPQPAVQPPVQPQPVYSPVAPRTGGMQTQQRMTGFGYPDINQYTYDPFINDLTPQEKNEFGDLFIACKTGRFEGLPIYVIGGNNEEFFRKVFIYLGKFRKDISAELLDKLYLYVSKNS